MIIKFIIHLAHSTCRCFSLQDLKTNVEYAIKEHWEIVRVEAV